MKKFMVTGFAVWTVLLLLSFSACDASLDPSDSGDSAISKPRGELTITGITGTFTSVYVLSASLSSPASPSVPSSVATGPGVYSSPATITLRKSNDSVWDGTGDYYVFLLVSLTAANPKDIWGYCSKERIKFDKGSASVGFSSSSFNAIEVPDPTPPPTP